MKLRDVTSDFPLMPQGIYDCEVSDIKKGEGPKGPYFNWQYEVLRGEFAGRKLFDITSLSQQSLWNLKKLITTILQDEDKVNELLDMDVTGSNFEHSLMNLKGRRCRVYIEHAKSRKDPLKQVEDVKDVFPAKGVADVSLDESEEVGF